MVKTSDIELYEDGLGADWLRCVHLGRPGTPVIASEY